MEAIPRLPNARSARVELRRLRVRRDLAHCALTLMAERGFEATTVEEIAGAAGYHPSSFFRYFKSKEEAIFIGIPEATAEFSAACAQTKPGDDVWTRVRTAAVASVENFTEQEPEFSSAQFDLWLAEPALQAQLAAHFIAWEQVITKAFTIAAGRTDPDLYSFVVGGAIVSVMRACARAHHLDDDTFAHRVDRACLMLERGLDRPPAQE